MVFYAIIFFNHFKDLKRKLDESFKWKHCKEVKAFHISVYNFFIPNLVHTSLSRIIKKIYMCYIIKEEKKYVYLFYKSWAD